MMTPKNITKEKILGWSFWAAILLLYVLTASRAPTFGDSGELLATSMKLALPHPPGFPLYTFLAHLFYQILPGPDAWTVSALSALCSLFCLQSVFRIIVLLTHGAKNNLVAYLSVGLLALSTVFWQFAVHVEVIALNTLLFCLCTEFCCYTVLAKPENKIRFLLLAALCGSLGVANHHTIIFVLPQSLLALYTAWPQLNLKRGLYLLGTCFSFVFIYILFALVSDPDELISWRSLQTPYDLWHVFLRKDYGTFTLTNYGDAQTFPLAYLRYFLIHAWHDLHILLIAAPGVFLGFRANPGARKSLLICLWASLLLATIGFFTLFNAPMLGYLAANNLKFFALPQATLCILGACGLEYLFTQAQNTFLPTLKQALVGCMFFLILLTTMISRLPLMDASAETSLGDFCQDTLAPLPKNAIVLGGSDDVLFACGLYFIQTKALRDDLHLMHAPPVEREMKRFKEVVSKNHQLKQNAFLTLNMSRPWEFIAQLLDALPGTRVFMLDVSLQPDRHYFELTRKYTFIPWGAAAEIVPIEDELNLNALEQKNISIYNTYKNHLPRIQALSEFFPTRYHHAQRLQTALASGWAELANLARVEKKVDMSFRAIEKAIEMAPWISEFYFEAAKLQTQNPHLQQNLIDYRQLLDYARTLSPEYSIYALPQAAFKEMVEDKFSKTKP